MPIKTTILNESPPIVLATYEGHISGQEVEQLYAETGQLLGEFSGKYYWINDVSKAETSFEEFLKITSAMRQGGRFHPDDPDLRSVFIGSNTWIYNLRNIANKLGSDIPAFPTMDEAMDYIQLDIDGHFNKNVS